jgi:pimeloyl-ACP methyl ester carboxylesterase
MLRVLAGLVMTSFSTLAADDVPGPLSLAELRATWANPADKFLTIDGVDVCYRDEGQGPAIVLIHGSSSTLRTYDAMTAILKDRYRVIRYDNPPLGLSGPVPDAVVGKLRPSDLPARLLKHLGIASATVVGVSSGGTTGTFLAAEHPALVERLVVSNAPAAIVDMSRLVRGPSLTKAEETYGLYGDATRPKPRHYWRTYWDFYAEDPARISEAIIDQFFDFNRRVPEKNATALIGVVADQQKAIAAADAVTAPVLVLWGSADPLLPGPAAADVLARRFIKAPVTTVLMPDVNHYPPIEAPARVAAFVEAFIRGGAVLPEGRTPPGKR